MFTGIITDVGRVRRSPSARETGASRSRPRSTARDLDIGASVCHAGCCLTVVEKGEGCSPWRSRARPWRAPRSATGRAGRGQPGARRPARRRTRRPYRLRPRRRGRARCSRSTPEGGSHRVRIRAPAPLHRFIAAKGSIAVEGVSLTVNEVEGDVFGVNIIPHTLGCHHARPIFAPAPRSTWRSTCWRATSPAGSRAPLMRTRPSRRSRTSSRTPATGRPYILVDAEDRENEGDVIIPAQFATPEQINFMAKHARGLICLSITAERARALRLPPMASDNQSGHGTAFTVSIEAREGVTTGISAHDRAHTVAVAIDPTKGVGRHRLAGPRLPAGGQGRRRAGPRRPHRGRGRHLPHGRPQPGRA